jgi:hypothetical protein
MQLNNWAQGNQLNLKYDLSRAGPGCHQQWQANVFINGVRAGSGWGKKQAESKHNAATAALDVIRSEGWFARIWEEDDTAHDAPHDDSTAPDQDSSASDPNQDAESGADIFHDNTDNHASLEVADEEDSSFETDSSNPGTHCAFFQLISLIYSCSTAYSGDVTTDRSDSPGISPLYGDTSEGLSLDFSRSECYAGGSIGCGNRMDTQIAHYHLSGNVPLAAGILISTASFQWKFRPSLSSTTTSYSLSLDTRALPALSMAVYASKVVIPKRWGSARKSVKHFGFMMAALSVVPLLVGVGPG